MRKQKDIVDVIKMVNNYRSFLINKEKLNLNFFKKYRLYEIAGFLYGLHYCLGYTTPIQSSFQLYDLFPEQVLEFYHDTLWKRINNKLNDKPYSTPSRSGDEDNDINRKVVDIPDFVKEHRNSEIEYLFKERRNNDN